MKTTSFLFRPLLLLTCAFLLLTGCGKDDENEAQPAGDGTVTWTHGGTTYTSTINSSAFVQGADEMLLTGGSADLNNIVSLRLMGIATKGKGVYELKKGSALDDYSSANILIGGSTGKSYSTLYLGSAVNGTITVTEYDKGGQKLAGTFSFTAGAIPNTSSTGTQSVTNGSFSFTRFR
ncbi:hypothetical protein LRS06_05565 [Hymenobacter sp. J193]|uniref:hypothetical protein n=1 Tax=Hymenobacter sp. J193 TaxID=2898429 RepID=UPI002150F0FC|nr:hypothetical protein [Hymenobacter sp. J193]MCR5887254.1 hypothetical protein [Hymenobacter sp. J193]